MKNIPLDMLEAAARTRPAGYVQFCLSRGDVVGSDLILSDRAYEEITRRFPRGAGDVFAMVAKPIARAIDGIIGTDLEHCIGCDNRQEKFNSILPFR